MIRNHIQVHGNESCALFVHEDHPSTTANFNKIDAINIVHTCHEDIDRVLGNNSWIIPRGSGASRSFPFYLAWLHGYDYIISLDDDCLPDSADKDRFIELHLRAFSLDRWFRTISGEEARGVPYGDKGKLPVLLNHGLWNDIPDLDAPTRLVQKRKESTVVLPAERQIVPPGMYFALSAMNVCYCREAILASYNLLMGEKEAGFDRFEDIWSGLFLKRIADHLDYYITSGIPRVVHQGVSDPFNNLRKEASGIQIHEVFWKFVDSLRIEGQSVKETYSIIAHQIPEFDKEKSLPFQPSFFTRLSKAMLTWVDLFTSF